MRGGTRLERDATLRSVLGRWVPWIRTGASSPSYQPRQCQETGRVSYLIRGLEMSSNAPYRQGVLLMTQFLASWTGTSAECICTVCTVQYIERKGADGTTPELNTSHLTK